jgi:uncharacterized protein
MVNNGSISTATNNVDASSTNTLFPVFLKLENLRLVIIGGGNVAEEKLNAVLQNAPATMITIVAIQISETIRTIAKNHVRINLVEKLYEAADLHHADVIIAAVNDLELSTKITADAHAAGKLINVADKPALCDFYLGSIVKKGNLKIGISTNGKSPTIAKRLKEVLNDTLPAELDDVLANMGNIRDSLKGDFAYKVKALNKLTQSLASGNTLAKTNKYSKSVTKVLVLSLLVIACMVIGHIIFTYTPLKGLWEATFNLFR